MLNGCSECLGKFINWDFNSNYSSQQLLLGDPRLISCYTVMESLCFILFYIQYLAISSACFFQNRNVGNLILTVIKLGIVGYKNATNKKIMNAMLHLCLNYTGQGRKLWYIFGSFYKNKLDYNGICYSIFPHFSPLLPRKGKKETENQKSKIPVLEELQWIP